MNNCFGSVSIVQEVCREASKRSNIYETQKSKTKIAKNLSATDLIGYVVENQSAQYESFIRNFSDGFKESELEMYKWILYPILTSDIDELEDGLKYSEIREKIEQEHPVGEDLNPGNLTQALQYTASLQADIGVKPIILDYDRTNTRLSVVDRGFLIWLATQNEDYLLERAGLAADIS